MHTKQCCANYMVDAIKELKKDIASLVGPPLFSHCFVYFSISSRKVTANIVCIPSMHQV